MYTIKKFLEDFYVSEAMALPLLVDKPGEFFYYLMIKRNISTFDAISKIRHELNIHSAEIGYAGLKDEDGVTSQYISLNTKQDASLYIPIAAGFDGINDGYIRLTYVGTGNESINIGVLNGNSFRLRIRNIGADIHDYLKSRKKIDFYAVNYYGQQRFGLPGQPGTTPIIGKYLLDHCYDEALSLLAVQQSELGKNASKHRGDAKTFFAQIDQRQLAFLLNSYVSFQWNTELNAAIKKLDIMMGSYEITGNKYFYIPTLQSATQILGKSTILPYSKFVYSKQTMTKNDTYRNTVIHIVITVNQVYVEDGDFVCDLSFFLPSGSYATVVIDQFMNIISNECVREILPRMMSDA